MYNYFYDFHKSAERKPVPKIGDIGISGLVNGATNSLIVGRGKVNEILTLSRLIIVVPDRLAAKQTFQPANRDLLMKIASGQESSRSKVTQGKKARGIWVSENGLLFDGEGTVQRAFHNVRVVLVEGGR